MDRDEFRTAMLTVALYVAVSLFGIIAAGVLAAVAVGP